MRKIADRKFFSVILLLLFFAVKGLSYHSMAHSSEEEQILCELCEVVILNDTTPFTFSENAYQLPINFAFIENRIVSQPEDFYPETTSLGFYSRPPPSLY